MLKLLELWNALKGFRTILVTILTFLTLNITDISHIIGVAINVDPTTIATLIMTVAGIFMRTQTTTPVFSDTVDSAATAAPAASSRKSGDGK